jgi:FlaA1/EpsC-like NDP-sugar epimerase
MSWLDRNRSIFFVDVALILLAAPLSFLIRLDASPAFVNFLPILARFALAGLLVKPSLYWAFGLYRPYWRYASIRELKVIVTAVTFSSLVLTILFVVILLPYRLIWTFPRSVLAIDWLLQLTFVGGIRFLARVSAEGPRAGELFPQQPGEKRILIAGAGDAGTLIVREMLHNPGLGMVPIAFVDDDPNKIGRRIHDVPVLGTLTDIPALSQKWHISEVVIAMPTAPGRVIREVVHLCEKAGIPSRTMPGIYELLGGSVSVSQLRDVKIEDLLRRSPVDTDTTAVSKLIQGKRVLVTGGGGSIGSELCRQVLRCEPAELVVLGHGENSVFEICNELVGLSDKLSKTRGDALDSRIYPAIADIRFADRLRTIFEKRCPDMVFHAAAHKHVPLMELSPCEAITNNVLGTANLLDISLDTGVEHFVMISSDKAVRPSSMMGASKRAAELLVRQAARDSGKAYLAVRFGNVLGSRGSVVSLFMQQIAAGGPVTVTDPKMERYFMTIPEAVQLILQAAALGRGGEVFVLDMGEPVKIVELAGDMIELSGLEVGQDIDIVFTGVRPGEKLTEELYADDEQVGPTRHPKIKVIHANALASSESASLQAHIDQLICAAQAHDEAAVHHILHELLPEANLMPPTGEKIRV